MRSLVRVVALFVVFVVFSGPVSGQYSRFQNPVWHPDQDIIAVTNRERICFYSGDFSQLLDEYVLVTDPAAKPRIGHMDWSPDGTMIAVSLLGEEVVPALQVWDFQSGLMIAEIMDISPQAPFSWGMQSDRIAAVHVVGLGYDTIRIYGIPGAELIQEFDPGDQIVSIEWSPDNRQIALDLSGENAGLYEVNIQTGVFTKSPVRLFDDLFGSELTYNADGSALIGLQGTEVTFATVLDASTFQIITTLDGHTDRVIDIYQDDGNLVTVSADGITLFWDIATATPIAKFQTGRIYTVSFSPDGRYFVADSSDLDTSAVWDSASGEIVAVLDNQITTDDEGQQDD